MKPELHELKATYEQPCDLTNNSQILTISTADSSAGKYFVIQTERWAFDNIDELIETVRKFKILSGL